MDEKNNKEEYMMQVAYGGSSWIITAFGFLIVSGILSFLTDKNVQLFFLFLAILSGIITLLLLIFFRDPDRLIGNDIVAVADGVIRNVNTVEDEDVGPCFCISTFMNIYHVHVNRMPIDGRIEKITYIPGSHLPAFTKKSARNERVILFVKTRQDIIKIILIAGTLARRIVPYVKQGDTLRKGEKISLIRLGSRVDVYLPTKMNIAMNVNKKDRVKAGVSTIATSNV